MERITNLIPNSPERFRSPYGKIVSNECAVNQIRQWHDEGLRVVAMDAVLDIPTYRHADSLRVCANLGDRLLLRVNSDEITASRKDPRGPIVPWSLRAIHAAHYQYVDLVTVKEQTGYSWLEEYRPDILVKNISSGSKVIGEVLQVDEAFLQKCNTRLIFMDEHCQEIIPREEALQRAIYFEQNKYDDGQFTGSIIKREIARRAIEDFLSQEDRSSTTRRSAGAN